VLADHTQNQYCLHFHSNIDCTFAVVPKHAPDVAQCYFTNLRGCV